MSSSGKKGKKKSQSFRSTQTSCTTTDIKHGGKDDSSHSSRNSRSSDKYQTTLSGPGTSRRLNYESNDYLTDHKRTYDRYAGLHNGGSTCYMNSVLQQLYHTPGISEDLGMTRTSGASDILHQMKKVFESLDAKMFPYMAAFWRVFKLWGEPIRTWEQQDAYEFFVDVVSQLDDCLKETRQKEIFKPRFQGMFSDIKDCHDCSHRYESQEPFLALSLTVKPEKTLETALEQFVQGVRLEKDNAYLCEKCGVKRDAVKTMCIKTLPPVLVIHLKRIKMDWTTGRATKFNDFFQFPKVLDMEPYTLKAIEGRAKGKDKYQQTKQKGTKRSAEVLNAKEELYQLVGVVVHTGQASSGHYYSLIKDRRGTAQTNATKGKWFKFNDTSVGEYALTKQALASECFGGSYKDQSSWWSFSSSALRPNSGYMLFYEKVDRKDLDFETQTEPDDQIESPVSAKKIHTSTTEIDQPRHITTAQLDDEKIPSQSHQRKEIGDKQVESSSDIHREMPSQSHQRGGIRDKPVQLSSDIHKAIHCENRSMKIYTHISYRHPFNFIQSLATHGIIPTVDIRFQWTKEMVETSIEQAVTLLPRNFVVKYRKQDIDEWCSYIQNLLNYSRDASEWAVKFLGDKANYEYVLYYLVEHHDAKIRQLYVEIVVSILQSYNHHLYFNASYLEKTLQCIFSLLDKEVPSHSMTCAQYFIALKQYMCGSRENTMYIRHMLDLKAFQNLMTFLIGPPELVQDTGTRKWTSYKAKEFAPHIHSMLANMIVNCDLSSLRPTEYRYMSYPKKRPSLAMPDDMRKILSGVQCFTYIRESVLALCEYPEVRAEITAMLLHCCYCHNDFTVSTLTEIQKQIETAPVSHLQPLFDTLLEVLLMKDPLQKQRLQIATQDENNVLDICMKPNHEEHMQLGIKFYGKLAEECHLLKPVSKEWQKAVKALKSKKEMTDEKLAEAISQLTLPSSSEDKAREKQHIREGYSKSSYSGTTKSSSSTNKSSSYTTSGNFYSGYT